jgi:hypothetical protein
MAIQVPKYDDQYSEDQFIWLQRPMFWWKMARDLAESAETILRSHDRTKRDQERGRRYRRMIMPGVWQNMMNPLNYKPAYLLYALAIENTLKGIIVGRDNSLISPKRLASIIKDTGHDLKQICRDGKIDLPDTDSLLLDKLTATIKWAGRYPTPLHEKDLIPIGPTGKRHHAGLSYWGSDREDTRALYRRLDAMLWPLLRDMYSEDTIDVPERPKRHKPRRRN